ncbi:MAG: RluA family pseudouridine synthase [Clostridia bacterium]|nr:RluA family pseudouridine synthase [Clostridia bacterium]
MDGIRCGGDAQIMPGAEVAVYTPYHAELPVVFENDRLLAVDKPAGVSCDADAFGSMTALDWARLQADGAYEPLMCHRLDNPTSGLLLMAKDEETQRALMDMFAGHEANKTYACLVRGAPVPPAALCSAWLRKDAAHSRVKVTLREAPGAKRIETAYQTLHTGPVSLLSVTLLTGRTHQIRAHMAALGHPVLGDDLYGDRNFNKKYGNGALMLRSVGLTVQTHGKIPEIDGLALRVPQRLDEILSRIEQKAK